MRLADFGVDGDRLAVGVFSGRWVLAQALEYAAWLAGLSGDEIERLANNYLQPHTLAEAWHETFAGEAEATEAETAVPSPPICN